MEGYSEDTPNTVGVMEKEDMLFGVIQMIRLGFFLFIIKPNSKLKKNTNNMRSTTNTKA